MHECDEEEVEWFVVKDERAEARFKQACYSSVSSNHELSRKVTSVKEWDDFLKDLRSGKAWAVGYKWFPYTRNSKLKGNDRELEVEAWFEQPDRGKGKYMVIHVHFETKWHERRISNLTAVKQVNLRHTQTTSNFWEKKEYTHWYFKAYPEEFGGNRQVDGGSEAEGSAAEGSEAAEVLAEHDGWVVEKSKKTVQSEKREAEAELANRGFPVASFASTWDRKDLRADTGERGTHAKDLAFVLDTAFGDTNLFYYDESDCKKRSAGALSQFCCILLPL